jgi:hypothetical protein
MVMRFWWRELAGWLLVGLGLYVFFIVASLLLDPRITYVPYLSTGPLILIGFFIFRGGIHLLKVAIAARTCMRAQAELTRQSKAPVRRPPRPAPWEE